MNAHEFYIFFCSLGAVSFEEGGRAEVEKPYEGQF